MVKAGSAGRAVRRVCVGAAVLCVLWVGPAGAQSVYTGVKPPAAGSADTGGGGTARLEVQAPRGGDALAVTGTDVLGLAAIGCGAIGVGTLLRRRARV
ncbi:MAG: hypothetical protein QOG43_2254 [Actinomycetota bacterium]|jgi:hypothetical protein|nr:hypothetical protein [Actinomycetota bacterium]